MLRYFPDKSHALLSMEAKASKRTKVVWKSPDYVFLPDDELVEVVGLNNRKKRSLVIAAAVEWKSKSVRLIRGDFSDIAVPFSAFSPSPKCKPVFESLAITDYGQTVRLGKYEAATDALLFECDPEHPGHFQNGADKQAVPEPAKRANRKRYLEILAKVPDVEPEPWDR